MKKARPKPVVRRLRLTAATQSELRYMVNQAAKLLQANDLPGVWKVLAGKQVEL